MTLVVYFFGVFVTPIIDRCEVGCFYATEWVGVWVAAELFFGTVDVVFVDMDVSEESDEPTFL